MRVGYAWGAVVGKLTKWASGGATGSALAHSPMGTDAALPGQVLGPDSAATSSAARLRSNAINRASHETET